jgi:hypothetical protein
LHGNSAIEPRGHETGRAPDRRLDAPKEEVVGDRMGIFVPACPTADYGQRPPCLLIAVSVLGRGLGSQLKSNLLSLESHLSSDRFSTSSQGECCLSRSRLLNLTLDYVMLRCGKKPLATAVNRRIISTDFSVQLQARYIGFFIGQVKGLGGGRSPEY